MFYYCFMYKAKEYKHFCKLKGYESETLQIDVHMSMNFVNKI